MKTRILLAATAALLSLPLALHAAKAKKQDPFTAADTNGDGRVSAGEYTAAMKGKMDPAAAAAKCAELDRNKDGSLDRSEFTARSSGKKSGKKKMNGR